MSSRKVYVVQEMPRINYYPALDYGDIVYLTSKEFRPFHGSSQSEYILDEIAAKLRDFDPVRDSLVMTGGPIIISIVINALIQRYKSVQVLQWDRQESKYIPFMLSDALLTL